MMKMPIHIHGSVDDAHTILLRVEEDYFTRDFKEYIRKERLYGWRLDLDPPTRVPAIGWVFWSQLDHSAHLIRQAIQKLIGSFNKELAGQLVQFWAPTKTFEGRTLLTTQFQPFALAPTYLTPWRNQLCEYRMGMCREYFYADAECAQEQLGLPGRVFLNQLPESTPHVYYYTLKEYPQRDLALRCKIVSSFALPLFEHSSHTCVGVLEIVSLYGIYDTDWHDKEFLGRMYDIFQDVGVMLQQVQLDQPSMDPSNKGQNVVTAERNILVVSSSKNGKRKTQDEEHKKAGVRIEVSLEEILKYSKMKRGDAAKKLKVSISTLKRVCRDFGIDRWPPRNIEDPRSNQPLPVENPGQTPQLNYDLPSNQASASVAHIKPSFQNADMVTIYATFENNMIRFPLSLSATFVEMQQEVAKRLNLEAGNYYIKYIDDNGLSILIACDEDLQFYLHACISLGISFIPIQLEQK